MEPEQESRESSYEALKTERYLWMARAFAVVSVLAIIANILLLVALGSLRPLTRIQPFLLNVQDKDQQVIDIERINLEKFDRQLLEESYVRQYIIARYTVSSDIAEVQRRWQRGGTIDVMTADALYREFEAKEMMETLALASEEGMTREVIINKVLPNTLTREWTVYFTLKTVRQSYTQPMEQKFKAVLGTDFLVRRGVTWEKRLRNPLGFTVVKYQRGLDKEG